MSLLSLDGITKRYPGVVAADGVSLTVGRGEIHALLGENGAGKSTLVKAIFGLVRPDAGAMTLEGRAHAPASPAEARAAGVAMVFQHFSLWGALDVAENVSLGMADPPGPRALRARIAEVSAEYGLAVDPARRVGDLSAGERQRVEVVRCLLQAPRLLIMDEPTSVLTPQEGPRAVRHAEAARGRGDGDPLHLAQARGDPKPVQARHRAAARPGGGGLRPARGQRARAGRDDGGRPAPPARARGRRAGARAPRRRGARPAR